MKKIKAKLNLRNPDAFSTSIVQVDGMTSIFEEAFTLENGETYYTALSLLIPTSKPFSIKDLEIISS